MAIATTPNDNALVEDKKDLDSPTRDSQQTPEKPSDNQKPLSSLSYFISYSLSTGIIT